MDEIVDFGSAVCTAGVPGVDTTDGEPSGVTAVEEHTFFFNDSTQAQSGGLTGRVSAGTIGVDAGAGVIALGIVDCNVVADDTGVATPSANGDDACLRANSILRFRCTKTGREVSLRKCRDCSRLNLRCCTIRHSCHYSLAQPGQRYARFSCTTMRQAASSGDIVFRRKR
jgi:hypothetical protein